MSETATPPGGSGEARREGEVTVADRDGTLVARTLAGDSSACDTLVQLYMRSAFLVAFRGVGNREDAEDVVQESFVAALEHLGSFEIGRPFGPWLMRVVMNRAATLRRRRALRDTEEERDGVSTRPSALDESERADLREHLVRALGMLSERQRLIVTLFDVDDRTSTEIGEMLGLSAGTVRWHLHEARRTLRSALSSFAG